MYDFLSVKSNFIAKAQRYEYYPSFQIKTHIKDLMVRAKDFYALFDPKTNMWITDEATAIDMIDKQVEEHVKEKVGEALFNDPEHGPIIKRISDTDNHLIDKWHKFCSKDLRDSYQKLNQKVKFSNSEIKREDYCTYKLPYPLQEGSISYYEKLRDTLYLPEESTKWEWMAGCLIAGEQHKIQKFFVFYGEPGKGKSTAFDVIIGQTVFCREESPYVGKWTAGMLVNRDQFGTEFLAKDPIYVIDGEAQLDKVETCATLNLIVSHEAVRCNSKFAPAFTVVPNCILVCGSNDPVQASPKTGFARRLIDIRQTGETLPPDEYDECINQIQFERSGIAYHCLQVYKKLGKNYYNHYVAEDMFSRTDPFHNYVKDNYTELKDGTTLANAYTLYQIYAQECNFKTIITRYKFRDNLKLYFESYGDLDEGDGKILKNWFSGFKSEKIGIKPLKPVEEEQTQESNTGWLTFDSEATSEVKV